MALSLMLQDLVNCSTFSIRTFCCSWCGHSWDSIRVSIIYQTKLEKKRRQGTVKMKILRQKCNHCCAGIYEDPEFTVENINVILNNLLIRIRESCYGEDVDDDELQLIAAYGSLDGPHQPENCEACQLGICARNPGGKRSSRKTPSANLFSAQCKSKPAPPIHDTIPKSCTDQSEDQPACGSCLWKCCGLTSLILIILLLIKIIFLPVT
ncbi:receptor-transporting protein 3-like [Lissotriton helveticus]